MAPRKSQSNFKEEPLESRKEDSARIRAKYPERVPVILEKAGRCDLPDVDKHKYLVPVDLQVGQFMFVVRKRIKLDSDKAMFLFINNVVPTNQTLMSTLYEEHKDEDGYLYITYSGESTFG